MNIQNPNLQYRNMQKESLVGKKLKTYSVIRKLGAGTYSVVYEAVDAKTKQRVAIKAISFKEIQKKPKLKELVETQIKVLRSCQNENVIRHIDSFKSDKNVFIVTEFCDGGDVQSYLDKKARLSEEEATDFLKQILNGFKGLHEVKAMHRDFKLANLLLHNKIIKIADLGFAKQLQKEQSLTKTQLGTGVTMAPQVLDGKQYGMYADIWSLGVVYYQMIFGFYPFTGPSDKQIRRKIEIRNIPYPSNINISEKARDFIQRCLTIDPKVRISWSEIYFHPLITEQNNMLYSLSVSKQKLMMNKEYYLNNEVKALEKFIYPEKQQFITEGQYLTEMKADQLKEEFNLQILKNENEAKKRRQDEIFQYEKILLKKRNNIMFMFKFFVPKIVPFVPQINAIHSVAFFFICKKALIELQSFVEEINQKKSSNKKEKSTLKYFFDSPNCLKLLNLLLEDIEMIKQQAYVYMQEIKNSPAIEVEKCDVTKWKTQNYSELLHEVFDGYWFQIAENVESIKVQKRKNTIIEALKALEYYYTTDEVNTDVFKLMMETLNYEEYKDEIVRKIYDLIASIN